MSARAVSQALLVSLTMVGIFSPANALTQQELIAKLEAAGYSQIREVKSTAEDIAVRAMKDGKEVSLVLDSSGQIKERQLLGSTLQPRENDHAYSNDSCGIANVLCPSSLVR
jgi:hypothetical protein